MKSIVNMECNNQHKLLCILELPASLLGVDTDCSGPLYNTRRAPCSPIVGHRSTFLMSLIIHK